MEHADTSRSASAERAGLLLPLGLAAAAALLFALMAWIVEAGWGLALLDDDGLRWVVGHRTRWLTDVLRTLTWLGSGSILIPVVAVASVWLLWRRRDVVGVAMLILAFLLSSQTKNACKVVFERPRPPAAVQLVESSGFAFPSGHASDSLAVWVMLAIVLSAGRPERWRGTLVVMAAAIALIVGASRVYLGVHWPTDVIAGEALAAFWVGVLIWARRAAPARFRSRAGPTRT